MVNNIEPLMHSAYLRLAKHVEQAQLELKQAQLELKNEKGDLLMQCPSCKKVAHIKELDIENHYWHVPPRGCMGGDYHKFCHTKVVCSCGNKSRLSKDWTKSGLPFKTEKEVYE